jgi:hypothetical protein
VNATERRLTNIHENVQKYENIKRSCTGLPNESCTKFAIYKNISYFVCINASVGIYFSLVFHLFMSEHTPMFAIDIQMSMR